MLGQTSDRLIGGVLAVVLAVLQFRLIAFMLAANYARCVAAATGVVEGRPHWRIYQSRLLGPYVVDGLARVFPSAISAHAFFSIAMLVVAGALAWRIGARAAGRRGAVAAIFVLHGCFALLLGRRWLYTWDFVDVIVFLVFVDFVVTARPWPWFVGLFAVGLFNHEIVVFVALWLVVDPLARWALGRRGLIPAAPLDRSRLLAGVACVAAGWVLVEGLRTALLVEEIGPRGYHGDAPTGGSLHVTLWTNLEMVARMFTEFDYAMPFIIPVVLVGVVALAVSFARHDPGRYAGLAAVHVAMIGSLVCFGVIDETRIYVVLIPLVVLASARLVEDPAAPPLMEA